MREITRTTVILETYIKHPEDTIVPTGVESSIDLLHFINTYLKKNI